MYRSYENPHILEKALKEAKRDRDNYLANCKNPDNSVLLSFHEEIENLEQRLNFAYQDLYEGDF